MATGPFGSESLAVLAGAHLLAALVSALLAAYVASSYWDRPIARVFALLLGTLTVWTLGSVAKLFTLDPVVYVGLSTVQYVGITLSTALLLLFALLYDGRDRWVTRRVVSALLVVPALTLAGLATTTLHGLFYTDFIVTSLGGTPVLQSRVGPWFWGWATYG